MKTILSALLISSLVACSEPKHNDLETRLLSIYQSSTDPVEQYKACILLAELPLDEQLIQTLSSLNSPCASYVLAKSNLEPEFQKHFIDDFYDGEQLKTLWKTQSESGYVFGILPPAVKLLAELARQNDVALDKLVSLLKYADGAYAESLSDEMAELYLVDSARIELSFKRNDVSEEAIRFIKQTAEYK
jgi:hypothetical protein